MVKITHQSVDSDLKIYGGIKAGLDDVKTSLAEIVNKANDITKLGVVPNTDVTNALSTALTNATDGDIFYFPKGVYKISGLTITKQVTLYGNEAVFKSIDTATKEIRLNVKARIEGMIFDNVRLYFPYNHSFYSLIRKNKFKNVTGIGAIFGETGFNTTPANISIIQNEFESNAYSIKGGFSHCTIEQNIMNNGVGNRNIEINMGRFNTIKTNKINTGITGITFLVDASLTKQIPVFGNKIKDNNVQNISEEGISFDVWGNDGTKCGSLLSATVSTVVTHSNFQITIDKTFSAFQYLNSFVVFLDGVRKGDICRINDMPSGGTSVLQLEDQNWQVRNVAGSKIAIIIPFLFNEITGNTLTNCTLDGIYLYGNCIGTLVQDNTLNGCKLSLASLGGLITDRVAVSFNNVIKKNNIYGSEISFRALSWNSVAAPLGLKNEITDNNLYNSVLRIPTGVEESTVKSNNKMFCSVESTTA